MRSASLSLCLCALLLVAAGCHRRQQQENRQGLAAPTEASGASAAGGTAGAGAPAARAARPAENLACKLLTKNDAETLLGEPVQATPVTSTMADVGAVSWRCGYLSANPQAQGPTTSTKVVTLLVKHWQDPAEARSAYEHAHALSQTISGQVPEPVAGLGERAYWAGGKVNQLNVLAGSDWLVISGTQGPGLDQLAPAKAAAARILAHH